MNTFDLMELLMWPATLGAIVGTIGNVYKRVWSYWVWTICNLVMAVYNFQHGHMHQALLWSAYVVICVCGIYAWTKAKKGKP